MSFKEILFGLFFGMAIPAILLCYIIWKFIFIQKNKRLPIEFEEENWLSEFGIIILVTYYASLIIIISSIFICI
jgi:hypothetical protein